MSLVLHLKKISNLSGKYDRQIRITFRGYTHVTKKVKCELEAVFNEILVDLEVRYQPVEGAVGLWSEHDFVVDISDRNALIIENEGYQPYE
ncbi:hypothetical protein scyTo_0018173 [Scyliorhinus torazame]|uniref:Uncharacterized protein n=1 Tax=Scyliorhinus torazame TaxID=75743 RepID=A0A401PPP6_SCYTO|nr:hypothetical protein [Scyliorhinus torazame]